jgi:hypothetical protein
MNNRLESNLIVKGQENFKTENLTYLIGIFIYKFCIKKLVH